MIDIHLIMSALKLDDFAQYYRVKMNPEEALVFFQHSKPRCQCYPAVLRRFIAAINDAVPLMEYGPENPNTGKQHHSFWVGREGYRVVYLDIAKLSILFGKEKDFDFDAFGKRLILIAEQHHAYEADVTQNDIGFECRFWWKTCLNCDRQSEA